MTRAVERALLTRGHFGGHLAFVHRLVRQHRRRGDVADGEDVRHVGAHLLVDRNEAALGHLDPGELRADGLAVGHATDRHQHPLEHLRGRRLVALEADAQPVRTAPRPGDLGVEQDLLVARPDARSSGRTRSGSQPGISCPVSSTTLTLAPSASYTHAISSPMMPPPITSRPPENSGSSSAPVESMMRGSSGSPGSRTASEPAAMMHCSKRMRSEPLAAHDLDDVRAHEAPRAAHHLDLALLRQHPQPAGELGDDGGLPRAQLARSMLRLTEGDAALAHLRGVLDDLGGVQQRLRGNAADVQAHATELGQRSTSVTLSPRSAARNAAV